LEVCFGFDFSKLGFDKFSEIPEISFYKADLSMSTLSEILQAGVAAFISLSKFSAKLKTKCSGVSTFYLQFP